MARRSPAMDPELKAHQEWLGYLQPVGLVVAPAAMQDAGWVVTRSGSELIDRQVRYRAALEPLDDTADPDDSDTEQGFRSLLDLLTEHLGWDDDQLDRSSEAIQAHTKELPELGDTLTPTAVVPAASGEGAQLLVVELPLAAAFDQKSSDADHLWRASAQERLERLLRETGVEAGLLFNGNQLRLVVAPKGESSGYLTFRLSELAEVSGRLMLSGLDLLLGQSHVFLDPDGYRLSDVLKKSRSFQALVSNALADQILAALWDLLRGFQQADELSQQKGNPLLGDLPERDPQQLYGGLITMLMRLVFLLYAEDEALMPSDAVYEQNYKLSAIFEQLQQDESEYPDTMEQRFGAWMGLMSLCRLVYDGGGPSIDYLPARHGQLFDPNTYPWLETQFVNDRTVLLVLKKLLIVNGERISYRALDVEQIGSIYQELIGFRVETTENTCAGIKSNKAGSKNLVTIVDLEGILLEKGSKRSKLLEDIAEVKLQRPSKKSIESAQDINELRLSLSPLLDLKLSGGIIAPKNLVLQPTPERRNTGSHYTPRSLTRPTIENALQPVLHALGKNPSPDHLLDIRVCDPAMGSGAFLVEACRYLGENLVRSWQHHGLPDELGMGGSAFGEDPEIYARRLVAQRCLFGVDKNIFAVNLAKISLWLISLSKKAPFTFVDHCLICGDSLSGVSRNELIDHLGRAPSAQLDTSRKDALTAEDLSKLVYEDTRSDEDYDFKTGVIARANQYKDPLRKAAIELFKSQIGRRTEASQKDLKSPASIPICWDLEFKNIFDFKGGFDCVVGNPPFLSSQRITEVFGGPEYGAWLKSHLRQVKGYIDLSGFFLFKAVDICKEGGTVSLVLTSSICRKDNRKNCLAKVINEGMDVFNAKPRLKWPGDANLEVSVLHMIKGRLDVDHDRYINDRKAEAINSFLMEGEETPEPSALSENSEMGFIGSKIDGAGFELSEKEAETYLSNPLNNEVIFKLAGGDEVNAGSKQVSSRFVINFGSRSLEECEKWPELVDRIRTLVKPKRDAAKNHGPGLHGKKYWWQHTLRRDPLYSALSETSQCLALSLVSRYHIINFMPSDIIFNHKLCIFPTDKYQAFAVLQSSFHSRWSLLYGARQGATPVYSIQTTLETFPFPAGWKENADLKSAGEKFFRTREEISSKYLVSLTDIHAALNSPSSEEAWVNELRQSFMDMDIAVLATYGLKAQHSDYCFYNRDADVGETGENQKKAKNIYIFSIVEDKWESVHMKLRELNKSYEHKTSARAGVKKASRRNIAENQGVLF